jgi:RNA polymerase sigma-70 factor (ECF subfamily)
LLEEYVPRVYRFALRLTCDCHAAEDLTQDTFLRAWPQLDRLREPSAMRVWLFRITANLWSDQLRRRRLAVAMPQPLIGDQVSRSPGPDVLSADREQAAQAVDALECLPARQRDVLYLNACEDLSASEIAEVLGISVDATKASLSLARKKMRQLMSHWFEPENCDPMKAP